MRGSDGLLTLNLRAAYVSNLLQKLISYDGQVLLVVDRDNQVVFSGGSKIDLSKSALGEISMRSKEDFPFNAGGAKYHLYKTHLPQYGLTFLSMVPDYANRQLASRLINITLLVILVITVIGSLIAYTTTEKNRKQLSKIVDMLDQYDRKGECPDVNLNPLNLYDVIMCNILKMFLRSNQMKMQLAERKYKMDLYELKALQIQINPHFLYNTLETISWKSMEQTNGYSIVNEMIENLSLILKYCLSNSEERVALQSEIKYTKCYMSIQNVRYNNQFHMIWEYNEEDAELRVIKLLFQPLVENAIMHGVRHRAENGMIKIRVYRRGDRLNCSVIDNGIGMDKNRLSEIRHSLTKQWQNTEHIGLINTNQRLRFLYGETCSIHIRSKKGLGTSVRFSIPIEKLH